MTATETSVLMLPPEKEQHRLALISKLCRLQARVNETVFGYSQPADCFCLNPRPGESALTPGWPWANEGKVVDFIVQIVEQHLIACIDANKLADEHIRGQLAELAAAAGVTPEDIARLRGAG